jgi:hypothetical protein
VILLDRSGVDLAPKSTPYAEKAVELQDSNMAPAVILLDWSGVDLTPKSTPYAKKLMELQDSNAAPDQIYTINSKSWH